METEKKEQPKESGHFYRKDGTPAYTITGKNGKERNTTLRDARKEGLVPSVTTIIAQAARPGLENWKAEQVLMSALTCPHIEGESNEDWIARIKQDAKEQAEKAREKGTQIHAWVQSYFEDNNVPDEAYPYCISADNALMLFSKSDYWICEKSFACDGYGGKVDMHTPEYVIDIKTTDKPLDNIKTWDEHALQLAAYRHGLGYPDAKCGILYINTIDSSAKLLWIDEDELKRGLEMFMCLKNYYYAKTGL